jgi:pantoate--beta-alanine ligase
MNAETLRQQMTSLISREPLAKIEYVSVTDTDTLEELSKIDRPALASLAVKIGKTRLIDNMLLE